MSHFQLPSTAGIGYVHLKVADLGHVLPFYKQIIGFQEIQRKENTVYLSAKGNQSPLLILSELPDLHPHLQEAPGLYHLAILMPDRTELARILKHLIAHNIRLGFGDHTVSEAIYLYDPEGNGLELYADRPREQWHFHNGNLEMTTTSVNVPNLLNELRHNDTAFSGLPAETRIGHVHLQVSNLAKAEQFYSQLLGFDVMQRTYPGALFVAAGGYHHHVGLNIWHSRNTAPAPDATTGLYSFSITVPDTGTLAQIANRLQEAAVSVEEQSNKYLLIRDFDGIRIEVRTANGLDV